MPLSWTRIDVADPPVVEVELARSRATRRSARLRSGAGRGGSTPSGTCRASSRYSGSVSGPQLAVPRPRWAASMWTIVSGDRDDVDVVGRRGEVRGAMVRDGDLARLVELDADAGRAAAVRPARLEPADVGVAAVLLRPDVRDVLVVDGRLPEPDQAAALAIRVRLVRTGAEPAQRLVAGAQLQHGADARQVVEGVRDLDGSPRPRSRRRGAACRSPRAGPRCRPRS